MARESHALSEKSSLQLSNQLVFSDDSSMLFARGDLSSVNNTEILATTDLTTPDQSKEANLLQAVPSGGDVLHLFTLP